MSYTRRLMVTLALLVYSAAGFTVGLGDLESTSSLNEPFDARVEIINLGELDPDLVKVRLASVEDFERVGTARELFLMDLRFSVDLSNPQKPAVKITSSKPVREPYLDFLVELKWPAGRILRSYTVFLDLPVFAGKVSPQIAANSSRQETKTTSPVSGSGTSSPTNIAGSGSEFSGGYRVRSGDTLWNIAERSRPQGSSVQQAMTAIYDQNPGAFIDGDMNRVRRGALLALPDAHTVSSVDQQRARTQVARSVEDLKAREEVLELVTSTETEVSSATAAPKSDGVLRLLTPDISSEMEAGAGDSGDLTGGEGGINREALENELAIAEEKLIQAEQDNQVLAEQLVEQQAEIAKMSRLLELEGNELAAIQQGLEPEEVIQDKRAPVGAESVVTEAVDQTVMPTSFFDEMRDKLTLIAGGLLILILGVLFLLSRGRGKQDGEMLMSDVQADIERNREQEASSFVAAAAPMATEAFDQEPDAQPLSEVTEPEADLGEVDPIGEADIYLSFGDYAQAEAVVQRGLERTPDDSRVHLKLLDILAAQGDVDRFDEHYPKLLALGDTEAILGADRMRESLVGVQEDVSSDANAGFGHDAGEQDIKENDVEELLAASPEEFVEIELPETTEEQLGEDLDLKLDVPVDDAMDEALASVDEDLDMALDIATEDLDADSAEVLEEDLDLALEVDEAELVEDEPELEFEESLADNEIDLGDLELDLEGEPAEAEKSASLDFDDFEDDLDSLVGGDEVATQLELAQAYVDMGDQAGAMDILNDVIANGSEEQQSEAQAILAKIS